MTAAYRRLSRLALFALALASLLPAGCLLAVAGVAGAGAAGYAYYNGLLYRDYHANLDDTLSAVRTSLVELQFPILEQKGDTGNAYVKTRTADGHTVRIHLDVVPSPIPIEGALTRVGVRVGFSGDEAISARVLDQVSRHLVPPGSAATPETPAATVLPPRPTPSQPSSGVRPASFDVTGPPPLAGSSTSASPTAPAGAPRKQ